MTCSGYVMTSYFMTLWIGFAAICPPTPRFVWNMSASVPIGLYQLTALNQLKPGDLVVAHPPTALARYMNVRRYLAANVPLLKHIAALRGQTVCRHGLAIIIDGRIVAMAREADQLGRSLPHWDGCHRLKAGEVFLLNVGVSDSFDGRYFGVLPATALISRARPLWTRNAR